MKRFFFGVVWFLVFGIISILALGAFVGGRADDAEQAYEDGNAAGRTYGRMLILGSFLLALGGSVSGVLPGTKPKA